MTVIRWFISWGLFLLGDAASRPMNRFDWAWACWAYQKAMAGSCRVQGDGSAGPWQDAAD